MESLVRITVTGRRVRRKQSPETTGDIQFRQEKGQQYDFSCSIGKKQEQNRNCLLVVYLGLLMLCDSLTLPRMASQNLRSGDDGGDGAK